MYKKIMYLIIGVILTSFALADTNVSIDITSTEDITFWANPNTPGETTYYLDGVNYKSTVNDLWQGIDSSTMTINYVYYKMSEIFIKRNPMKNIWEVRENNFDNVAEQRFRWVMDTYFVPRTEVNQMMNFYENRITDLELRVLALENLAGDENVLKGRLNVAKDLNLTTLVYNGDTYHNVDDGFITLETIEQPEINVTEEVEETIIDLHQNMIENWKRLCDRGIKKFCLILEQRGYLTNEIIPPTSGGSPSTTPRPITPNGGGGGVVI